MTFNVFTLERFRLAGRGHLHGARCILRGDPSSSEAVPALASASASYLAHVALECALKARLLEKVGCRSVEELEKKHPKVHNPLFTTKQGHDLDKLAKELGADRLSESMGKKWREDTCWKRLSSSGPTGRPYSLRYGIEDVDEALVAEDVARCAELLELLLSGLRRMKRERHPEKK